MNLVYYATVSKGTEKNCFQSKYSVKGGNRNEKLHHPRDEDRGLRGRGDHRCQLSQEQREPQRLQHLQRRRVRPVVIATV